MDADTNMSMPRQRQVQLKRQPLDAKMPTAISDMFTMSRSASASSSTSAASAGSSSSASSSDFDEASDASHSTPGTTPPSSPPLFQLQHSKLAAALEEQQNLHRLDIPADALTFDVVVGNNSNARMDAAATAEPGPAAFFPGQRLGFSPKLRVLQKGGVRLDPAVLAHRKTAEHDRFQLPAHPDEERLCGMMLGLTGVAEILHPNTSAVQSTRIIADYSTDLSSGMKVWHRDATVASRKRAHRQRLPCGTYVLPLTMRLPSAERLPPSFESAHYRVRYTLTVALFSRTASTPLSVTPNLFATASVPFTILPSTLPSPAPPLPALRHNAAPPSSSLVPSFFSSVAKLVRDEPPAPADFKVQTSLPTSSYSPSEVVPVTLDIRVPTSSAPTPAAQQQIFVRLTLLRRLYVRESGHSLEQEDDWGFGSGASDLSELLWERYEKEEVELGQRWGVVTLPASVDSKEGSHFQLKDIQLPLTGLSEANAGCTTSIDLAPAQGKPTMIHGDSSWFSPAAQRAMDASNSGAWSKHFHVSSRFFVAVEIGFFNSSAPLQNYPLNEFISCAGPPPFANRKNSHSATFTNKAPAFPGKLRELLVPIIVGSVSEPGQAWHLAQTASSGRPINRDPEDWQGEARGPTVQGEDGAVATPETQGHWVCPPPSYEDALVSAPGYV